MKPLVVSQRIAASPSTVYDYLTESDKWSRWQGVEARLEAREGGIFSMVMGNGMRARGEFKRLVPDELVVFTWGWIDHPGLPPGSTEVEISLEPDGPGTMVTLVHRALPEDEVDLHKMGWTHHLPRLAVVAEGGDPGREPGPG